MGSFLVKIQHLHLTAGFALFLCADDALPRHQRNSLIHTRNKRGTNGRFVWFPPWRREVLGRAEKLNALVERDALTFLDAVSYNCI